MTELEVACKVDRLVGRDEGDRLEDHVRDGLAGKHVARDELVHDLRWHLLVCDGLEHGKRDGQNRGYGDTDDSRPDGELRWVDFDGDAEEREGDDTDESIPPDRDLGVVLHEARVHITLVLESVSEATNNVLAEPEEGVYKYSGECGERNTTRENLGGGHEYGRVCNIFCFVEDAVGDNLGGLVHVASVIEGNGGGNGEESGVKCIRDWKHN